MKRDNASGYQKLAQTVLTNRDLGQLIVGHLDETKDLDAFTQIYAPWETKQAFRNRKKQLKPYLWDSNKLRATFYPNGRVKRVYRSNARGVLRKTFFLYYDTDPPPNLIGFIPSADHLIPDHEDPNRLPSSPQLQLHMDNQGNICYALGIKFRLLLKEMDLYFRYSPSSKTCIIQYLPHTEDKLLLPEDAQILMEEAAKKLTPVLGVSSVEGRLLLYGLKDTKMFSAKDLLKLARYWKEGTTTFIHQMGKPPNEEEQISKTLFH